MSGSGKVMLGCGVVVHAQGWPLVCGGLVVRMVGWENLGMGEGYIGVIDDGKTNGIGGGSWKWVEGGQKEENVVKKRRFWDGRKEEKSFSREDVMGRIMKAGRWCIEWYVYGREEMPGSGLELRPKWATVALYLCGRRGRWGYTGVSSLSRGTCEAVLLHRGIMRDFGNN